MDFHAFWIPPQNNLIILRIAQIGGRFVDNPSLDSHERNSTTLVSKPGYIIDYLGIKLRIKEFSPSSQLLVSGV